MSPIREAVRGWPLNTQPKEISKCGMSRAQYAQHRASKQWYKLSPEGRAIDSPLQLDFYRQGERSEPQVAQNTQELATTEG